MKRSEDRILTTHAGSLIRPKELISDPWTSDRVDVPLTQSVVPPEVLRRAVADVVAKQAAIGLDVINDGEFGKSGWANYILTRINGIEVQQNRRLEVDWLGRDRTQFAEFYEEEYPTVGEGMSAEVCVGPVSYGDRVPILRDLENLKSALEKVRFTEAFYPSVAPASATFAGINEYYATEREYMFAVAEALREEYLEIHRAGILVQVDDAVLANLYDALVQKSPQDYRRWAELRIEALNHALAGIPEDRVRYHVCFGSWHAPHVADAPLEEIVEFVLQVRAQAYSFEASNPRHEHEWRVWEKFKLPEGKILIPGVVTHHTIVVEHPQLVADRIVRFANLVGRENVIAGTDCGFAQVESVQRVHPSVMWAKLESLVEGARIASKLLWGR